MSDINPCPFCGSTEVRIDAGGQVWCGVKGYSEPQYYHLRHNGKLKSGDGFQSCFVEIRGRTGPEVLAIWNNHNVE